MVKHVVMWRVNPDSSGEVAPVIREMKKRLESLKANIPDILELEVGVNFNASPNAYHLVLLTQHTDEEALKRYQEHPIHQEVVKYVKTVASDRAVVDFQAAKG